MVPLERSIAERLRGREWDMDIGSVKPVVTGLTAPVPRAPAVAEQAAPTELPPPAAVGAARDSQAADADFARGGERPAPDLRKTSGEFVRDLETKDLVFRWIDVQSGEVVRQMPDEAVLRVRAMMDSWGAAPTGRTAAYDITA